VLLEGVPTHDTFPWRSYSRSETIADVRDDANRPNWWKFVEKINVMIGLDTDDNLVKSEDLIMGECDIKAVRYIDTLTKDGDSAFVAIRDSDLLFILLLYLAKQDVPRVKILLDLNHHRLTSRRYMTRFVSIDTLCRGLKRYALAHWPGLERPLHVLSFLAIMGGSDYTTGIVGVGAATLIKTFRNDGWKALRHAFAIVQIDNIHPQYPPSIRVPWLKSGETEWLAFCKQVYRNRKGFANVLRKTYSIDSAKDIDWATLINYARMHYTKLAKPKPQMIIPPVQAVVAEIRRTFWVLLFWSLAECELGAFPNTVSDVHQQPIWGWSACVASTVTGSGKTCFSNAPTVEKIANGSETFGGYHSRLVAELSTAGHDTKLVVCKTNTVIGYEQLWDEMFVELELRIQNPLTPFAFPAWEGR